MTETSGAGAVAGAWGKRHPTTAGVPADAAATMSGVAVGADVGVGVGPAGVVTVGPDAPDVEAPVGTGVGVAAGVAMGVTVVPSPGGVGEGLKRTHPASNNTLSNSSNVKLCTRRC